MSNTAAKRTTRSPEFRAWIAGIERGLDQAAKDARERAIRTKTALVYEQDGQLIKEYPHSGEIHVIRAADEVDGTAN
ncbi:hypothetical protein [Stratiformator vulcanicus]|uniref:Uncharacterized protein n=1 Tax=Stratiformator vulcanicus TaxID=2527980 RepID=A0A517R7A7_9PLAN|nr:hypothetical protein [Stratiformator vulcanicus]QDT39776.1 hypothetical protein Pan189_41870 [Stratiformator vulcanicus]